MHTAIIGTAGRKNDFFRLNREMWSVVQAGLSRHIAREGIKSVISGGAAWADHLAVQLFNNGEVEKLTLFLPAPFEQGRFKDIGGYGIENPGGTTNYYHKNFSTKMGLGFNSFADITVAIERGAEVVIDNGGFFGRNSLIAEASDSVVAFTFGTRHYRGPWVDAAKAGLKDGGTAHCWSRCSHVKEAIHYCL